LNFRGFCQGHHWGRGDFPLDFLTDKINYREIVKSEIFCLFPSDFSRVS